MSRVMQAWEQVLREAVAADMDEREFALFQIGLVLLRHNPHIIQETDVEEETLSRELMRLALNDERQKDAVVYLATLVRTQPKSADSIFVAMSNAQAQHLVAPLLDVLQERGNKLNKAAAYSALMALDNVLKTGDEATVKQVRDADLLDLLDTWSESKDNLLADRADRIAGKIEELE